MVEHVTGRFSAVMWERSSVASGLVGLEQGCYLGHHIFEKENWSKSFVHKSLQHMLGWQGNDQMWEVPHGTEQVHNGMYNPVGQHIPESYNLQDRPQVMPACHRWLETAERNVFPALADRIPFPQYADGCLTDDAMTLGLVSWRDRVGAAGPIPYCHSSNTYLVREELTEFGMKSTRCPFSRHMCKTQQQWKISNGFALPYSASSRYVKPQVGIFQEGQTLLITNEDLSFHEPVPSAVVNQISPCAVHRNASVPVIQLPFNHYSMPYPYPPGFVGKQNAQNFDQNRSFGIFSAPQSNMVFQDYNRVGKSHHLYQKNRSANGMQHNLMVKDGLILEREAVTIPVPLGYPEIPPLQRIMSTDCRRVSPHRSSSSRTKKKGQIFKIATISPRPSSQQPNKTKNQFSTSLEPLTQSQKKRSVKGKSFDSVNSQTVYDLANAPIFQVLCENQTPDNEFF